MTQSKELTNQPTPQEQESPKSSLNRREFIVAGAAAASALAFPGSAQARGRGNGGGGGRGKGLGKQAKQKPAEVIEWNNPFKEPEVFSTETLIGDQFPDLSVEMAEFEILIPNKPEPIKQRVRTYNGSVPGPTYRLKPGEKLELDLINNLTPNRIVTDPNGNDFYANYDCQKLSDNNVPGCFNTTNLHTHGLHVSPQTQFPEGGSKYDADSVSSDDVHVRVPPENNPNNMDVGNWLNTRHYCFQLPEFHAPGTHWYHAHIHGATAIQVVNGLAGALIVDEPADQEIAVDGEKILIMQEIIGSSVNTVPPVKDTDIYANLKDPNNGNAKIYGQNPPSGNINFTINSLNTPTIDITTNEIQRWRVINATATPRGFMDFGIYDGNGTNGGNFIPSNIGTMNLIAVDGITFYGQSPKTLTGPEFMAPANRADFLVQFSQPGTYQLWKQGTVIRSNGTNGPTGPQLLAFINVTGNPVVTPKPLPSLPDIDKRPCYLAPITDAEVSNLGNPRVFTYNVPSFLSGQNGQLGKYTINGQAYGQTDASGNHLPPPNTCVQLGSAEEWILQNTAASAHPFHIHVNPFQVLEVQDPNTGRAFGPVTPENAEWWDSFSIPPGGSVRIRSRFLHYPGVFVQHCHILIHEDSGMMQDVTVQDPNGNGTGPCEVLEDCRVTATPLPEPVPES